MLKSKYWLLVAILGLCTSLSAFSIQKIGTPYKKNNVFWQTIEYKDKDTGFKADFPGESFTGLNNGDIFAFSETQGTCFQICCGFNERYQPPRKEAEFIQQVKDVYAAEAKIIAIASHQKTVKYIAELQFYGVNEVARIYCSKNQLYYVFVDNDTRKLTPLFFESIQITR